MGFWDLFKLKKWEPDLTRAPPDKTDWPDHILTLKAMKFDKFIAKYPLSIIDFWAGWCGPCKTIAPRLRQLSKMYKGRVAFGKVNVDNESELAKRFHISGIPNLTFFSYGEKVTNITGIRSLGDIQEKIDDILDKFND